MSRPTLSWIREQLTELQWAASIREIKNADLQQAIARILDGQPWREPSPEAT